MSSNRIVYELIRRHARHELDRWNNDIDGELDAWVIVRHYTLSQWNPMVWIAKQIREVDGLSISVEVAYLELVRFGILMWMRSEEIHRINDCSKMLNELRTGLTENPDEGMFARKEAIYAALDIFESRIGTASNVKGFVAFEDLEQTFLSPEIMSQILIHAGIDTGGILDKFDSLMQSAISEFENSITGTKEEDHNGIKMSAEDLQALKKTLKDAAIFFRNQSRRKKRFEQAIERMAHASQSNISLALTHLCVGLIEWKSSIRDEMIEVTSDDYPLIDPVLELIYDIWVAAQSVNQSKNKFPVNMVESAIDRAIGIVQTAYSLSGAETNYSRQYHERVGAIINGAQNIDIQSGFDISSYWLPLLFGAQEEDTLKQSAFNSLTQIRILYGYESWNAIYNQLGLIKKMKLRMGANV